MIRVGTWNVLGLTGFRAQDAAAQLGPPGSEASTARWVEAFSGLGCDLLALQEGVAHEWIREIARRGGWHVATIPSPQSWPGHVLSRHPIRASRVFSHAGPGSSREDPFSRCLGAALVELPGIGECWMVVLHAFPDRPETPPSESLQRRQLEARLLGPPLDELIGTARPMIVCGDFNSDAEEQLHDVLRDRGFQNAMGLAGGLEPTFGKHGDRPEHIYVLDHLYLDPTLAPLFASARVVRDEGFWYPGPEQPGRWVLSDHLPVVAELRAESVADLRT
jgi:endonuclease/exonuclease/phosphatase family metal-dependent hydrolase